MDEIAGDGKPCGWSRARIEARKAVSAAAKPERLMSTIAAIAIVLFLVIMAVLNKIEFGKFD